MAAELGFPSLSDIILKIKKDSLSPGFKKGSKIPTETFENALFKELSLKSQSKAVSKMFEDPKKIHLLRKHYINDIKNSNLKLIPKGTYINAINKAFSRLTLVLPIRPALLSGTQLKFKADRQSSQRAQYLRHKRIAKEKEAEEIEKEWDKFFEDEDQPEKNYIALQRKLAKEEEEKLAEEQAQYRVEHGHQHRGKFVRGSLATALLALPDPQTVASNLTHNLADLNHILQQSLQKIIPSLKLEGILGAHGSGNDHGEQVKTFNQNILGLELSMRNFAQNPKPSPDEHNAFNNQYNQVLSGFRQQYQHMQANIPQNNVAAQQALDLWRTQVEQNLTQWLSSGNVQRYDETFKNNLGKELDSITRMATPVPDISEKKTKDLSLTSEGEKPQSEAAAAMDTRSKRSAIPWPPKPKKE